MVRGSHLGSQNLFSIEKGGAAGKLWGKGGFRCGGLKENKAGLALYEVVSVPCGLVCPVK